MENPAQFWVEINSDTARNSKNGTFLWIAALHRHLETPKAEKVSISIETTIAISRLPQPQTLPH